MYTELVIIFAGLGLVIALLITILVLLIIVLKRTSGHLPVSAYVPPVSTPSIMPGHPPQVAAQQRPGNGVVFCKNCYTQFDTSVKFCPKCGTPKN